jgi:hypothetical protein
MEENVSAPTVEADPVKIQKAEREIYDWVFDNSFAVSLSTHGGIWLIGPRFDPDWPPTDFNEVRTAVAFKYAKHR